MVRVWPCRKIPSRELGSLIINISTDGCKGALQHVRYLEHVQAQITLSAAKRGDVEIYLTSPQGNAVSEKCHGQFPWLTF